jgi:hypothetical protein
MTKIKPKLKYEIHPSLVVCLLRIMPPARKITLEVKCNIVYQRNERNSTELQCRYRNDPFTESIKFDNKI